jgi:hypothetical protein
MVTLKFDETGSRLIVGGQNNNLTLLDIQTGKLIRELQDIAPSFVLGSSQRIQSSYQLRCHALRGN